MDSSKHGIICDLNKYRPGYNLKKLMDAGVDGFIFRMGGPTRWYDGDWQWTEDPTWRPYMDQAKALGIQDQCGGYIVHNPFEDWHLQGIVSNTHLNLVNQWTSGGYMPGYFIIDHEIATCWRGATEITCTAPNLVNSLDSVSAQMYRQWRRMVMIYTGRWFIDKYGKTEHVTFFDNVNRPESMGGAGMQRPVWYAGYPNQTLFAQQFSNLKQAVEQLAAPSATYVGNVLQCGSYSLATAWQVTDRAKVTGDTTGFDMSVTWGTWEEYCAALGIKSSTTPADTTAPSMPTNLQAQVLTNDVTLTWGAATDNVGVAGYLIYDNGVQVQTTTGTNVTLMDLANGTHTLGVEARDAAGNKSTRATVSVAVGATPPDDSDLAARVDNLEGIVEQQRQEIAGLHKTLAAAGDLLKNGA